MKGRLDFSCPPKNWIYRLEVDVLSCFPVVSEELGARLRDKPPSTTSHARAAAAFTCARRHQLSMRDPRLQVTFPEWLAPQLLPNTYISGCALVRVGVHWAQNTQRRRRGQSDPHLRLLRRSKVWLLFTPLFLFFSVSDWLNIINTYWAAEESSAFTTLCLARPYLHSAECWQRCCNALTGSACQLLGCE